MDGLPCKDFYKGGQAMSDICPAVAELERLKEVFKPVGGPNCLTCFYEDTDQNSEPCAVCENFENWEPEPPHDPATCKIIGCLECTELSVT